MKNNFEFSFVDHQLETNGLMEMSFVRVCCKFLSKSVVLEDSEREVFMASVKKG